MDAEPLVEVLNLVSKCQVNDVISNPLKLLTKTLVRVIASAKEVFFRLDEANYKLLVSTTRNLTDLPNNCEI